MRLGRDAAAEAPEESNIWPAMTDSIMLIASVFIVLSVVTMVFFVSRARGGPRSGQGAKNSVLCQGYVMRGSQYFASGSARFRSEPALRGEVREILEHMTGVIDGLKTYADEQGWHGDYFVVIEASGYADYRPLLTEQPYPISDGNWKLTSDRANALVYLIENVLQKDPSLKARLGFRADPRYHEAQPGSTVLRAAGYSSQVPALSYATTIAAESNPLARRALEDDLCDQNRRVEIRAFAQRAYQVRERRLSVSQTGTAR
jgi:flagellar motor protein MotB